MVFRKPIQKCCNFCTRQPVFDIRSKYCLTCLQQLHRLKKRRIPREAIKALRDYVRKHGWVCYYTGMDLDMINQHSPWYCVFDHWIPRDDRKIVITSALINTMKADLSEKEFWCIIRMLADFKRHGKEIRKIKLAFWNRGVDPYSLGKGFLAPHRPKGYRKCILCGKRIRFAYGHTEYCITCGGYVRGMQTRQFPPETIAEICDYIHKKGYKCFFTGMLLDVKNYRSPWYCVLSHLSPVDRTKIALTSMLLSVMKSGLTVEEFWYYILQLADYKEKHKKIRKKKVASWPRLCSVDDI